MKTWTRFFNEVRASNKMSFSDNIGLGWSHYGWHRRFILLGALSLFEQVFAGLLAFWSLALGCLVQASAQENGPRPLLQEQSVSQDSVPQETGVEVRLRSVANVTEPIVRLADLADCLPAQSPLAERLAQTELFPSPAPGGRRYVSAMEIEEILLRRGVPVGEIRLTGAAQVEIRRQRPVSSSESTKEPVAPGAPGVARWLAGARRRGEPPVQNAILAYLEQKVPGQTGWQVKLAAKEELKEILNEQVQVLEVRGGSPPWTGAQWFELILKTPQGLRSLVVQAEVSLPAAVVVAARPIPKGALLQPQDLTLQPLSGNENPDGYFQQMEELVGKEALRGLPAGRPIPKDAVQAPLLVRRGQVVTVYARAPGIRVRTQARSKDDGSLGDLVTVESLADRKTYFARVCGLQEVEVFARGVHTETQAFLPSETASSAAQPASTKNQ